MFQPGDVVRLKSSIAIFLSIWLGCYPVKADTLLTVSRAGTISIIKDLDADACEKVRTQALVNTCYEASEKAGRVTPEHCSQDGKWCSA